MCVNILVIVMSTVMMVVFLWAGYRFHQIEADMDQIREDLDRVDATTSTILGSDLK
jgi:hypothetical protein